MEDVTRRAIYALLDVDPLEPGTIGPSFARLIGVRVRSMLEIDHDDEVLDDGIYTLLSNLAEDADKYAKALS